MYFQRSVTSTLPDLRIILLFFMSSIWSERGQKILTVWPCLVCCWLKRRAQRWYKHSVHNMGDEECGLSDQLEFTATAVLKLLMALCLYHLHSVRCRPDPLKQSNHDDSLPPQSLSQHPESREGWLVVLVQCAAEVAGAGRRRRDLVKMGMPKETAAVVPRATVARCGRLTGYSWYFVLLYSSWYL